MARDLTVANFLRELGLRFAAAAVVVGIFVVAGYLNRSDIFGLSGLLGDEFGFFALAFSLVALAALGWIGFQRYRS